MYKGKRYRGNHGVLLPFPVAVFFTIVALMIAVRAADAHVRPLDCQHGDKMAEVVIVYTEEEKYEYEPLVSQEEEPDKKSYTDEELELLALVIYQEAGGDMCSDETRQMVGEVALNRVESDRFPDTLEEVLSQRAQYGRLYWTGIVWPERADLPQEAHAVQRAYDCAERLLSGTSERLLPEDTIFQAEFEQGSETIAESDGFYFCR